MSWPFLSPPVQHGRWAPVHHFLSVRPSVSVVVLLLFLELPFLKASSHNRTKDSSESSVKR